MSSQPNTAKHVAIIMDGNGRWAKRKHLPRAMGHRQGVEAVRKLVRSVEPMGIDCLTLYAFSSENWKRPEDEVGDLMNLLRKFIRSDLPEFIANDVRLKIIGNYSALAPDIVAQLEDALEQTAKGSRILAVALNYGSQDEIVRAAQRAADEGEVTAQGIERHLDTADLPPLDLLIRTSGRSVCQTSCFGKRHMPKWPLSMCFGRTSRPSTCKKRSMTSPRGRDALAVGNTTLPKLAWGGGPRSGGGVFLHRKRYPSTILRMVPLAIKMGRMGA